MRQRVVLHDRGGAFSAPAVTTVVLTYCNWEWVIGKSRYSETFEALSEGLQGALWQLGGVPREHQHGQSLSWRTQLSYAIAVPSCGSSRRATGSCLKHAWVGCTFEELPRSIAHD